MPVQTSNEFKIRFDGQLHQVEANTLISSLVSISTILQETNAEVNKDSKVNIKIKALSEGSFCVNWVYDFVAMAAVVATPLLPQAISTTSDLLTILVSFLDLKKHLKGEEPKTIKEHDESIEIENNSGKIIFINKPVYNLYTKNPKIQDAISSNFSTLQEDPTIESFEVLDANEHPLHVATKEDFSGMAMKTSVLEKGTRVITEVATLHVFKLVFDPKYKWEFYYKGNKISAYVTDDSFFSTVDSGEEFAKGDTLIVELQIEQVFDPSVNTYVNRNYQVLTVKEYIPRSKQQTLDLDW